MSLPQSEHGGRPRVTAEQAMREFLEEVRQAEARQGADPGPLGLFSGLNAITVTLPPPQLLTNRCGSNMRPNTPRQGAPAPVPAVSVSVPPPASVPNQLVAPAAAPEAPVTEQEQPAGPASVGPPTAAPGPAHQSVPASKENTYLSVKTEGKRRGKSGRGKSGRGKSGRQKSLVIPENGASDGRHSRSSVRSHRTGDEDGDEHSNKSSDYDTDLEAEPSAGVRAAAGDWVPRYKHACASLGTVPITSFVHQLASGSRAISLRGLQLLPQDVLAIVSVLSEKTDLQVVDAGGHAIAAGAVKHLVVMLTETNRTIEELSLADNGLSSLALEPLLGRHHLFERMTTLDLSANRLGDASAADLAEIVRRNSNALRSLCLARNEFSAAGIRTLANALGDNTSIQSLDLSWNEVRGEGAAAVAELVRENNFLKRLVLASNGLSDDGAAALGRSLAANAGLRELDLSSNRIGLRGAAPLAKALQQNEALETLRLNSNPITSKGAELIVGWVKKNENSALRLLEIKNVAVTFAFGVVLQELLAERSGIVVLHDQYVRFEDELVKHASLMPGASLPDPGDEEAPPPQLHPLLAGKGPVQVSEEDLLRLYLSKKRINILRYVGPEATRTMIRADTKLENIEVRVSDRKFESARLENAAIADDLLLDGTLMDLEAFKAFLEKISAPLDQKQREKLCKRAAKEKRIDIARFLPENLPQDLERGGEFDARTARAE